MASIVTPLQRCFLKEKDLIYASVLFISTLFLSRATHTISLTLRAMHPLGWNEKLCRPLLPSLVLFNVEFTRFPVCCEDMVDI